MNSLFQNFDEYFNLKKSNDKIAFNSNDLSLLFIILIYFLAITLSVFILEILIFFVNNYTLLPNYSERF